MSQLATAVTVATSGPVTTDEPAEVTALGLQGGSATSTAIFRDGLNGAIRWRLVAVANTSANVSFDPPLRFNRDVYVELSGTAAQASVAVRRARANQG
jgi:hypothetical protein